MRIILFLIFLTMLTITTAEIYQYDDVVFYPNGSQYINISKLYVDIDDLKNISNEDMLQVYIIYKNQSFLIPQLKNNITFDLPVEEVDLYINISATKESANTWKVTYTIENKYNTRVPINISFPTGYSLSNTSIVVSGNNSSSVFLYKNSPLNTLYFGDSNISYRIPSKIDVIYTPIIPISIEKSNRILNNNSIEWTANYSIYNNKNIFIMANISLWADVGNITIDLGNIPNVNLTPNSTYSTVHKIHSDEVPVFYIKLYAWNKTQKNIVILPALRVNSSYIIDISKVKGRNFSYKPPVSDESDGDEEEEPIEESISEEEEPISEEEEPVEEPTSSEEPTEEPTSEEEPTSSEEPTEEPTSEEEEPVEEPTSDEEPTEEPTSGEEEGESYYILGIEIKKLSNPKDIAIFSLSIFTLNLIIIPLFPLYLPPNILDNIYSLLNTYGSIRRVYFPDGIRLEGPLPLNIFVVHPNDHLVSLISRSFNIPLNSAKALAMAIEHGGILKTTDKKTYEIALKIGINAEFIKICDI
ncbi:hypothetical protein KKP97_04950 [Methanothermococcus sp. SCGC AD-155-C09]|nr:hypothetical protein [Methanothermococcus sp. SCGC AD-155-C09]